MILFRLVRESLQFAIQAIVVNKLRTLLTLLGITIGIFSVISVLTAFDSLENSIKTNINSLGTRVIYIQKWPFGEVGEKYPWWQYWQRPQPTVFEMERLKRNSNTIEYAAFTFDVFRTVKYKSNNVESTDVLAVTQDFNQLRTFNFTEGRYFTFLESNGGQALAILGYDIYKNLFGDEPAVGKTIRISNFKAQVIGVLARNGDASFGGPNDDQVIVPVSFALKFAQTRSRGTNTTIMLEPYANINVAEMKDEVTGLMRSIRNLKPGQDNDFAINQVDILFDSLNKIFGVISIVGWIVGGFSLLVGGFGIANIMFVSVKERTSQIGIQKSLGAKNSFILQQFLFESIFLSILGGILGLIIVFLLSLLVKYGFHFDVILNIKNIGIGIGISVIIGILAGYLPAYSASRLNPIDAIRSSI
ncbi:MAG: ABC transporter permease [Hyphomicrobiales bacterium]